MQYSSDEPPTWSTSRWEPPAPESYVLLHGVDRPDTQPFKLAITELVARGALKLVEIEEPGVFGMRRQVNVLTDGPERKLMTERSLAAVQRIFGEAKLSTFSDGTVGTTVEDLAVAAQRHYRPLSAYTTDEVLPTLVDRGHYAKESRRILGIFPSSRYVLTPSGQAARTDLRQRMDVGQAEFHGWARNQPDNAFLYMGMMGSSFLLMPMLFDGVDDLRRRHGDTVVLPSSASIESGDTATPPELGGLPPGELDVSGLDLGALDLNAFDGLDAALGAIDAGIDSGVGAGDGGGWSGGDGGAWGGGDGGGGGGGGD